MADKNSDATIDYGMLMHDAMMGLIRNVLSQVEKDGLPGEHHFFISFETSYPGVEMAEWLRDRFPDAMTIVMQHWFADFEVGERGFGITLSFNDQPEHLFIPYDAIRNFIDPSVEFALKFETQSDPDDTPPDPHATGTSEDAPEGGDRTETAEKDAEIVSLDAFRK